MDGLLLGEEPASRRGRQFGSEGASGRMPGAEPEQRAGRSGPARLGSPGRTQHRPWFSCLVFQDQRERPRNSGRSRNTGRSRNSVRHRNLGRSRNSGSTGEGSVWPKLLRIILPRPSIHPSVQTLGAQWPPGPALGTPISCPWPLFLCCSSPCL